MKLSKNKLNLGCGTDIKKDYVNLDFKKLKGVDVVHDLNKYPWPFKDNEFDEVYCGSNILGFVDNFVKAMEEIWRITKKDGQVFAQCALYPSLNCFSDPHVKKVFTYNSFVYFEPSERFNYYSKARFKTLSRKIIVSDKGLLKSLNPLANLFPKLYVRLVAFTIPPMSIHFLLRSVK